MRALPLIVVLVGPTASGKTALLDGLLGDPAVRGRLGLPEAEIVSADSMQAYRGLDIGTAKPGPELLSRLPHRLIDILDPRDQYTAGDFARLADEACAEIGARGRLPIVCGGTGFYVRNFVCGLPGAPPADPGIREAVARDLAERGAEALRGELAAADPASAARIHERDLYRLTRALEIVRQTGRPLAEFAAGAGPRPGLRLALLGLSRPRAELEARIHERVEAMMAAGLAEEVAALARSGLGPGDPGMKAIGYREFFEPARGGSPSGAAADPREVARAIGRDTRLYAKRQMTYFRALPGIEWIDGSGGAGGEELAARLRAIARGERYAV